MTFRTRLHTLSLTYVAVILGVGVAVACSSSSGDSSGGSSCGTLVACCGQVSGAAQTQCIDIATTNVDSSCSIELASLQANGTCGSATSTGTTTTSTSAASGCAGLTACCEEMTGSAATACLMIVGDGVAAVCTEELGVYQAAHSCGTGTGTGTGTTTSTGTTSFTGTTSTGATTGTSNHTGTTSTGHTGTTGTTGTTSSSIGPVDAGSTCTPHALPANYEPRTISLPTGSCTSAQDEGFATCVSGGTSCAAYESGTCTACAESAFTSNAWGAYLNITTAGPGNVVVPFLNSSGCIQKLDPAGGTACAEAINASFECELAACLAYCPVESASDTAGLEALGAGSTTGCIQNADSTVCATQATNETNACTTEFSSTAGTDCQNLESAADTGPFIAVFCGGEDSGT